MDTKESSYFCLNKFNMSSLYHLSMKFYSLPFRALSIVFVLFGISSGTVLFAQTFTQTDTIATTTQNKYYPSNRAPLAQSKFIKLPTGSIRPGGWLLIQLQLQKDGLCGHLGEISAWLQKGNNAWLHQGGEWGWEEVPYWLRGYSDLAFILKDKKMIQESKVWIDAILKSQRPDGNFGPYKTNNGAQDFWPNMLALWILQNYYEYTGDKRVPDFMTKYFHYQLSVPDDKFLEDYWGKSRAGDNLWSVLWLYNRTGNAELLQLADKLHRNTAKWTEPQALPNWHNVNVAQCFREPAIDYLFTRNAKLLEASYHVQRHIRRCFGQAPGGMFGADENARIGFIDPRQGTETCGFAEQMASDEIMLLISGDSYWAENCEDVAFNSFPAAFMPDYRALRYLTSPNMVLSDSKDHSPGIQNRGPFLAMNPFSSRCCQHNHGFAWPYYSDHLILATPDNGLAAVLFNSCEAKAQVGNDGREVILAETTDYPFNTGVSFRLKTKKEVHFPLYLRIPSWCEGASAYLNNEKVTCALKGGKYLRIDRTWKDGDSISLNFPMSISLRHWQVNNNSVSVDYGPLTLSLQIKENYVKCNSTNAAISDSKWQKNADPSQWPTFEIYPASPWNYALCTSQPVTLQKRLPLSAGVNPFSATNCPLVFQAVGRAVPSWKIDQYGLCGVLPEEEVKMSDETYPLTLIPMGAARLRISAFPDAK